MRTISELLSKDTRASRQNPKVLENGVVEGQTINGMMQVMCSEELPANVIIANHKSAIGAAKQINEVEAMRLQNIICRRKSVDFVCVRR